ncbi:helix-turn-helix transcriptional regulator [Amycolatopsis albispora]|uniref:DNA-binding transcriptional regulator n=1 Tax=Amycolatopsis albispora TaxID=1804986 RepID=A0A344LIL2_9PSEU|nr:WYL domain-containing protein [Amycolatopsis albispora]AXB47886.1 DNA-binding transcriptional regulator [Amycolatopsis albispora]
MTRQDMSTRLLRLLSLLQGRPEWPGADLAAKLGVTTRTVRRDVERLRQLGYEVEATTGTAGGYRLGAGQRMPLLQLDDDEAIAVAAGLVTRGGGSIADLDSSSVRALAKVRRMLPARLRPRLAALAEAASPHAPAGADPLVLATLASCCTERETVTFGYRNRAGEPSERRVEPHSMVTLERRWYLLGFDVHREDWRVFRVDRIDAPTSTRHRFTPRELPAESPADYVSRSLSGAVYRHSATMHVPMSADSLRAKLFSPIPGGIRDDGPEGCVVLLSTDSAEVLTQYLAAICALAPDSRVEADTEIRERLRALGTALRSA